MSDQQSAVTEPPPKQQVQTNPFDAAVAEAKQDKAQAPSLLSLIKTGVRVRPIFTIVYGPPGIGKTTFGGTAPKPIFLPTERIDEKDVPKWPRITEYDQLFDYIHALRHEKHEYKTAVLDTADGFEPILWKKVCDELKVPSMETLKFGKSYMRAKEYWREVLNALENLSEKMHVIMLAHAHIKSVNDPMLDAPYDTWKIKLHDKSAEVLRESVDNILFARFEIGLKKENIKDDKGRGILSGKRMLYSTAQTGFEAKNRFNLPNEMDLSWEPLGKAVKEFYGKP